MHAGRLMIVCQCNALSDKAIKACLAPGPACPRTPAQVHRCFGCSAQCGGCAKTLRKLLDEAAATGCGACPAACPSAGTTAAPALEDLHSAT